MIISLDEFEKNAIRENFESVSQAALSAVALSMPENADPQVQHIGDATNYVDQKTGLHAICLNMKAGRARLSVASQLTSKSIHSLTVRIKKLLNEKSVSRSASLLSMSMNRKLVPIEAFVASWSSLEILINQTFKALYQQTWHRTLMESVPTSARSVVGRLEDVMSDKYRLTDKFIIVASFLSSNTAEDDAKEFIQLKQIRDKLLHGEFTSDEFPFERTQKLAIRYMRLHVDNQI